MDTTLMQTQLVRIVISLIIFLQISNICHSQQTDTTHYSSVSIKKIKQNKKLKQTIFNDKAFKKYACNDTLFILYKSSKNTNKYLSTQNKKYKNKKFIDTIINYTYLIKDSTSFSFMHRKYFNFDRMESNITSHVIKRNKKFLRKNKRRILDNKFFIKYKHYGKIYLLRLINEIIKSKKIVFIIDIDEFFDKKITLREIILDKSSNSLFIDSD